MPRPAPSPETIEAQGQAQRERMAIRGRLKTSAAAEIGELPAVAHPEHREACRLDLLLFLTSYFPASTGLSPFSDDHIRVIARIQSCVLTGGRFCNAVYRGFAKTSIAEVTAIWATIYGHRRFVPLFGADASAADESLRSIKFELEDNDLLAADFPEICHPIRALDGASQRAAKQTYHGERTRIEWTAERIRLPTVPGAPGTGAVICTRGITAGFRGLKVKLSDGTQQRPDFIILDDPQTDEMARTPGQVAKTLSTLRKAILKLGGHRRQLAIVCNATVIEVDDAVDFLLGDAAWQGERIPMIRQWPLASETMWLDRYATLRRSFNRDRLGDQKRAHREATEFYSTNRAEMDAGAEVSWENCFDRDTEISALQHAYNILIDDGAEAFASECQQQPLPRQQDAEVLTAAQICERINRVQRGLVPSWSTRLTAFIDLHDTVLFWAVCAWNDEFTGAVVDYGTFPDQKRPVFTLRDAPKTLADVTKVAGLEAQLFAGLETLTQSILARAWQRQGGGSARVEKCLIDAARGAYTDLAVKFCQRSACASQLMPSFGRGIGASSLPMTDRKKKPGERMGLNWVIPLRNQYPIKYLLYDTNFWKSFLMARLAAPAGATGELTLFGENPKAHSLFAEHLTAEYRIETKGRGRVVQEWRPRPNRRDNHWFDCAVGCAVAASVQGCTLPELPGTAPAIAGPRKTLKQLQDEAKQRKAAK